MRCLSYLNTCLLLIILVVLIIPAVADESNKTLIAIYMVGSDLESLENCATTDIGEMLEGLQGKNDGFDLVIGYGGSRKMGWKGMTFATLDDIRTDYENGVIGDEKRYQFHDGQLNMGSAEGISRFLKQIQDMDNYDRYILFFWDHGGGYNGLCFDENNNMDAIDLSELKSSLLSSEIHWNLIGMDACLMGSYEVAKAVEGAADYLMVSEEAEPGHGWNYTVPLNALSQEPGISIPDWRKGMDR